MSEDMQQQTNLIYFQMNMLQATIEMNAMIEENKAYGTPKYVYDDFMKLIEKYSIHHNAFPFHAYGG